MILVDFSASSVSDSVPIAPIGSGVNERYWLRYWLRKEGYRCHQARDP